MTKMVIGSRESKLAVIQAEIVREALRKSHPNMDFSIRTYKTTGDIILDRSLDKVGGKGLFVKELERALLDGEADILVHSLKDVPMEVNGEIPIVAVLKPEDCRDALVLPEGVEKLDLTLPLGCSSRRRAIQLKKLYPGCTIKPIRGNVLTRLEKMDRGEFGALVLAAAGLKRLGLEKRINAFFDISEILPAACQGVLAVQTRADFDISFLNCINDSDTWKICQAERAFVRALDGGCSSPVAAHGEIIGDSIRITGLYAAESSDKFTVDSAIGSLSEAVNLAKKLAQQMKSKGALQ